MLIYSKILSTTEFCICIINIILFAFIVIKDFSFSAHAGVIPFIPVYAEQLGISASAVGVILAVLSCLTVVTKTVFGGIADHFQKLKHVLIFLILMDIIADLGLNFIPKPHQIPINITNFNILCYKNTSYVVDFNFQSCRSSFTNSTKECSVSCPLCQYNTINCVERNETGTASFLTNETEDFFRNCLEEENVKCTNTCFDDSELCKSVKGTNPSLQIYTLTLFMTLIFIALGSIVSLSDAACYNALSDQPQNFGKQRLWGTIGWGTFGLLVGYLNQVFSENSKIYNYSAGFYMLVILFAIDLIVINQLHLKNIIVSKNICKDVGTLLVQPNILLFIITMFAIGVITGIARFYLFWYLRTTLGANQLILGLTVGVQCFLGELPFFFFSGFIINKLGHINTFTMCLMAYGFKFLFHSFLTNPWLALPVELLRGPCFGSFYSAMTSYSRMISPKGTDATIQGIVSGTFEGLGEFCVTFSFLKLQKHLYKK